MKIPVFASSPTTLNKEQEIFRKWVFDILDDMNLEPRSLGQSDYPTQLPLREVYTIARHCAGGIILGFSQIKAETGIIKGGTPKEAAIKTPIHFPTAWNNLEAGILYSLKLPLIIFKEKAVSGGVFDYGVSDVFIHEIPVGNLSKEAEASLKAVFLKWQADVRNKYYEQQ